MKTAFSSHEALTELPWFRINAAGRLGLAVDLGYPAIDLHTHLALSYGGLRRPDLCAERPRTQHYLSVESALDLDCYANQNFTPQALQELQHDLTFRSLTAGGMRATHTAPNLRREMMEMGVGHAVLLPIRASAPLRQRQRLPRRRRPHARPDSRSARSTRSGGAAAPSSKRRSDAASAA